MSEQSIDPNVKSYLLDLRGDRSFSCVVVGEETLRSVLREVFYGTKHLIEDHIAEEEYRWEMFSNVDYWEHDENFSEGLQSPRRYSEYGEDYCLFITIITDDPILPGGSIFK